MYLNNTSTLFKTITNSLQQEKPFVTFRKPLSKQVTLYTQNDTQLHFLKNFTQSGFVFALFDSHKNTIFFNEEFCEITSYLLDDEKANNNISELPYKSNNDKSSKEKHINLVKKGIHFIINNSIKKIVLSRKEIVTVTDFNVITSFKKLLHNYPNAFIYCWYHPKVGLWLGATPETLIQTKENSFKTMALAGTQIYKNTNDVIWQNKEKLEQEFVTEYIVKNLNELQIEVKQTNPFTIKAGSLLHICTELSGKLTTSNTLGQIIKALHPTPAVCGLPKGIAKQFIVDNEAYNREFYTGYLGELNCKNDTSQKQTSLFVNLRCMQVENNSVSLYIGGGITKDSIPEKEYIETVAKADIMKKVLF